MPGLAASIDEDIVEFVEDIFDRDEALDAAGGGGEISLDLSRDEEETLRCRLAAKKTYVKTATWRKISLAMCKQVD